MWWYFTPMSLQYIVPCSFPSYTVSINSTIYSFVKYYFSLQFIYVHSLFLFFLFLVFPLTLLLILSPFSSESLFMDISISPFPSSPVYFVPAFLRCPSPTAPLVRSSESTCHECARIDNWTNIRWLLPRAAPAICAASLPGLGDNTRFTVSRAPGEGTQTWS